MTYTEQLSQLTRKYNEAVRALDDSYSVESKQHGGFLNLTSSSLKKQYSMRYEALAHEYRTKRNELFKAYKQQHPEWVKARRMWGWTFVIGVLMAMVCCTAAIPVEEEPEASALTSTVNGDASTDVTYWNADNIPIPYLQDSTQYVSNPDHVLSQQTVDRMNVTLQKLNLELGVQSVTIVVNHIENDDPFRMAQDVGNKYGVGHGDRGLIVVVGYEDHAVTMAPGRSLEGDLTDAECHRLQQQYVVPAMRQNMPDSAMIYLTEALYSTLQKKALPKMTLSQGSDNSDDEIAMIIGLTFAFLVGWGIFFVIKNRIYQWVALGTAVSLLANPFYEAPKSRGGFGGGGHFGGGGGGGFSGGSFGGGSFGGGGATSRW